MIHDHYLLTGIDIGEVGFPDGQLIACGMSPELALAIAEAFYNGGDMRAAADGELTPTLESIIANLETHSRYGNG